MTSSTAPEGVKFVQCYAVPHHAFSIEIWHVCSYLTCCTDLLACFTISTLDYSLSEFVGLL